MFYYVKVKPMVEKMYLDILIYLSIEILTETIYLLKICLV